ncbi:MAG: collagen-like protein, partial [Bacteroidota bacterium]
MKKRIFLLTIITILVLPVLAQVPAAFNYQAVVRNNSGEVVSNQNVSFRISILQGSETGTLVYSETHNVATNDFGLANLKIGEGTVIDGVFSPGGWGIANHFIKIELDPAGGSSYVHTGTSQLLAVPYAF